VKYEILLPHGDYPDRQLKANVWKADVYIEQHFNSKLNDRAEDSDNYSCVVVAHNAGKKSTEVAATYASLAAKRLGLANGGVTKVGYGKAGDGNLRLTDMPAVLLEPLFVSDLSQAELASSPLGQDLLAQLIVDTVVTHFPNGARVALSTGHKYQDRKQDPGAPTANGLWEADLADAVVKLAAQKLTAIPGPTNPAATLEARVDRIEKYIGLAA
jgi:N-acetylmuramoyl-L-alanine amidase